jgi:hypothetical protein
MHSKSIALITAAVGITLVSAGCGQKAADTSAPSQPVQANASAPLTPQQQAGKDIYQQQQAALMKAQYQASPKNK